jgi:hypothetical protein
LIARRDAVMPADVATVKPRSNHLAKAHRNAAQKLASACEDARSALIGPMRLRLWNDLCTVSPRDVIVPNDDNRPLYRARGSREHDDSTAAQLTGTTGGISRPALVNW